MADWNFVRPFVRRLRSAERFRPRAISRGERLKMPRGRSIAFEVSWTLRTHRFPRAEGRRPSPFATVASLARGARLQQGDVTSRLQTTQSCDTPIVRALGPEVLS